MTGSLGRSWSGRAQLVWALLGPSLVVLAEVESTFVVLNGIGGVRLPRDVRGWPVLLAGAVLVIVAGAQLSVGLRRRLTDARSALAEQRRRSEQQVLEEKSSISARPSKLSTGRSTGTGSAFKSSEQRELEEAAEKAPSSTGTTQSAVRPMSAGSSVLLAMWAPSRLRRLARTEESASSEARRIIDRFGLEPMWAFRQLDENLGVPAARQLARRLQLADARWAGHMTAGIVGFVSWIASYVYILTAPEPSNLWPASIGLFLLAAFAGAQLIAAGAASRTVDDLNRTQLYLRIGDLLELHRFELYSALDVPVPRDSKQEREGSISAWRNGSGSVSFRPDEARDDDGDVRQQVSALTELFRGPELVPYDGFVSWEAGEDKVELAFSRMPVLSDGHARLQVTGSRDATHAPFDITADSSAVTLVQVRNSVLAPADGGTARTTFDFQRQPGADGAAPELWFEISQLGRFVQLLRVAAPSPSAQPSE